MTPRTRLAWLLFLAAASCAAPKKPTLVAHDTAPLVANVDPKLVEMTAESTTSLLLSNSTTELGIRVLITGKNLPDARRPALNLSLVLDTSGSMEGDAIAALKASARQVVEKLREGDRLSIVTFHSTAEAVVHNTVVTAANREKFLAAIDHIEAKGTTDLAAGLSTGLGELMQNRFPQGINRIVLFSDGVPNNAASLPNTLLAIHQNGISVTSLGFGIDYDTNLMTQIARDTGGTFHFLDKPEAVAAVFDDELTKMTTVVGRNLQLVLEPGPGVTIQQMPGLNPYGDGRFYATVGDLPAGDTRDLMIPIRASSRAAGTTAELVQATLTFDDVIGRSGQQKRDAFVGVKASDDQAAVKAGIKVGLEVSRVRANAAASILQALQLARQGQIAAARQMIGAAIATVKTAAKSLKDADFSKVLEELESVGKQIAQMVVPPQQLIGNRTMKQPTPAPAMAPPAAEPMLRQVEAEATATVSGRAN